MGKCTPATLRRGGAQSTKSLVVADSLFQERLRLRFASHGFQGKMLVTDRLSSAY